MRRKSSGSARARGREEGGVSERGFQKSRGSDFQPPRQRGGAADEVGCSGPYRRFQQQVTSFFAVFFQQPSSSARAGEKEKTAQEDTQTEEGTQAKHDAAAQEEAAQESTQTEEADSNREGRSGGGKEASSRGQIAQTKRELLYKKSAIHPFLTEGG